MAEAESGDAEAYVCAVRYEDELPPATRKGLAVVARNPGITSGEIRKQTNLTPVVVSRSVKTLLDRGWITVKEDEKDRRIKRFGLTMAGYKELLRDYSRRFGKVVSEINGFEVWAEVSLGHRQFRVGLTSRKRKPKT